MNIREPYRYTLAAAKEDKSLLDALLGAFHESEYALTPQGMIQVQLYLYEPAEVVRNVRGHDFQLFAPGATYWLHQIELPSQERPSNVRIAQHSPFASSPLLLAARPDITKQIADEQGRVSWRELSRWTGQHPEFQWSHVSPRTLVGALTLAAMLSTETRESDSNDVTLGTEETEAIVRSLEERVVAYAEDEETLCRWAVSSQGPRLDALIAQEHSIIDINQQSDLCYVPLAPAGGTFLIERPLALAAQEREERSSSRLLPVETAYERLSAFLDAAHAQEIVGRNGYRLPGGGTNRALQTAIDSSQRGNAPRYKIVMPNYLPPTSPQFMNGIRARWGSLKRQATVYLVVDVSGSMAGEKLSKVCQGLQTFVDCMEGQNDVICIMTFSSAVSTVLQPTPLLVARSQAISVISGLTAGGETALLEAVCEAYRSGLLNGHPDRLNAIFVLTDGHENASQIDLQEALALLHPDPARAVNVTVDCIEYGEDADRDTLEQIARATGGEVVKGDPDNIRTLYEQLSARV